MGFANRSQTKSLWREPWVQSECTPVKTETTHIEQINPADHPAWNELHNAKGIIFRAQQPGFFSDWHIAPRRQYIITLSGEAEIGLKEGLSTGLVLETSTWPKTLPALDIPHGL
ncbi:MAG: hypothetical protein CM1200mP27_09610 [Chloroflexota bacterium]|nr:MAG: hypothetical protein CM1200mP27_09610 [Chloroflexota bacterium]